MKKMLYVFIAGVILVNIAWYFASSRVQLVKKAAIVSADAYDESIKDKSPEDYEKLEYKKFPSALADGEAFYSKIFHTAPVYFINKELENKPIVKFLYETVTLSYNWLIAVISFFLILIVYIFVEFKENNDRHHKIVLNEFADKCVKLSLYAKKHNLTYDNILEIKKVYSDMRDEFTPKMEGTNENDDLKMIYSQSTVVIKDLADKYKVTEGCIQKIIGLIE